MTIGRKRNICFVVTARPSYGRICSALEALAAREDVELQLMVAAAALLERYCRVEKVIENNGFRINWSIHSIFEGESLLTSEKSRRCLHCVLIIHLMEINHRLPAGSLQREPR